MIKTPTIGIYKYQHKTSGLIYVGQSINIEERYYGHIHRPNKTSYIDNSIKFHTINEFTFEIIEECNIEELNDKEIYYIKYYNSMFPNGYNLTSGGFGNSGILNINFDNNRYTFIHLETKTIEYNIYQYDFRNKYKLDKRGVSKLVNGKLKSYYGWKLITGMRNKI